MSKLGIKATTSSVYCAHINNKIVNIYTYSVPKIFTYKKKIKKQNVTHFVPHQSVAYITESVRDLIANLEITDVMVKKTESSTLMQAGLTDAMRHMLYMEGALLSLGGTCSVNCTGCFCQEAACVDSNFFKKTLKQILKDQKLTCADLDYYDTDKHAAEATAAACLI